MKRVLPVLFFLWPLLILLILCQPSQGAEWPPISPDELKMTSEPLAPGAPAIYLFRQVDRDDAQSREYNYVRIKILKEEGREHANVELEYLKDFGTIKDIRARTVQPDGRVVSFDGKPFDKTVVKAKGVRFLAKAFTLPDVQVGSILEYSYTYEWPSFGCFLVYDSHWILNEDLFTKKAKFSLVHNQCFAMRFSWHDLPAGTNTPTDEKGVIRLESQNIPAFSTEDYMPPVNELKSRVDFVYSNDSEKDVSKYWQNVGKRLDQGVEAFISKRRAMEEAVAQTVQPNDDPELKLRKLYTRVQQVRNLSFEKEKTAQEQKREKLQQIHNVEDVWKRGYGDGGDITWLYLALVRAAGFQAYPVYVSRRNEYFFDQRMPDSSRLNDIVVLVNLNGKDLFLDPGTEFSPFGLLPWPETGVAGLLPSKDGGNWVRTTLPDSSVSRVVRHADLTLFESGDLEGRLTVTFTGLEALQRRLEERDEDDTARTKFLEEEAKEYVPAACEIELTNKPDWAASSDSFIAEFKMKIPGWATGAGRRALFPVGIFSAGEKHVFEHTDRVHPIYLNFPAREQDEIVVTLPADWQVRSLPPAQSRDGRIILYSFKAESEKGTIRLERMLSSDFLLLDQKYYMALRNFFQAVRTGDEEQIVLQPGNASASN
jgi:Domain of Unknown Function with PDB structure (DUF3857)